MSLKLLLADDDQDDRLFFKDAVAKSGIAVEIDSVTDGEKLMQYLSNNRPLPDLVFMDLNMPCKNGSECLEEIRKSDDLNAVTIAVYSTSGEDRDVNMMFELGANIFIKKPNDFKLLCKIIEEVLTTDWKKSGLKNQRFTNF